MTARSILCGSCGADVPYGRLSCPSCGGLLASVAGGLRRGTVVESPEDEAASSLAPSVTPAAASIGGQRVIPSVLHDALEADVAERWDDETATIDASPAEAGIEPAAALEPAAEPAVDLEAPGDVEPGPVIDTAAGSSIGGSVWAPPPASAPPPIVDAPPPPGAYVPPLAAVAFATSPAMSAASIPAGPAAPARAWAGHGSSAAAEAALHGPAAALDSERPATQTERVIEFIGWLAVAGGALAAGGFLLPWGSSVIGARGVGYLDRWGLAGPFHAFVALAIVAVVVLALVRNPVPTWIRIGLAGVILGTLCIGLVWPYLFGLSGTGPGALAAAIGAALLLAAGLTCLVTDRHARQAPPV